MGSHKILTFTEVVLQVFEHHEDKFFWPLDQQRDAKLFVKHMHDLGYPYEDLSRNIGELEDNFRAWRKGLGRIGIGSRILELINNSVGDVMDDDDDIAFNLQQLAKVKSKDAGQKSDKAKAQPPQSLKVTPVSAATQSSKTPSPAQSSTTTPSPSQSKTTSSSSQSKTSSIHTPVTPQKATTPVATPSPSAAPTQAVKAEVKLSPASQAPKTIPAHKIEVKEHKSPTSVKEEPKQVPTRIEPVHIKTVDTKVTTPTAQSKSVGKSEVHQRHDKVDGKSTTTTNANRMSAAETKEAKAAEKKETDSEDSDDDRTDRKKHLKDQTEADVDEVRRKMDAIKKKVEMMKRMKAEQAAQQQTARDASPDDEDNPDDASPDDKLEAMKRKLHTHLGKFREDSQQEEEPEQDDESEPGADSQNGHVEQEEEEEKEEKEEEDYDDAEEPSADEESDDGDGGESPPVIISPADKEPNRPEPPASLQLRSQTSEQKFLSPNSRASSGSSPSSSSPVVMTPSKAMQEEAMLSSSSDEDEKTAIENYNSDLDPDNYDSDLDYSTHQQIKELCSHISKTKSKVHATQPKGGPAGHIYVFTDSPPSEARRHRIKVGCSRRPECRLSQGRSFNPSLRQVSSAPVNQQGKALYAVRQSLREFQIMGQKSWYEGPIDVLLKLTADSLEKFNTGGSLLVFKTGR